MVVNVLGTPYKIIESNREEDSCLEDADGYCDYSTQKIIIDTFRSRPGSQEDLGRYKRQVVRHEIVHAFLHESGLDNLSSNEDLVDWIAIQFPKLQEAFIQAEAHDYDERMVNSSVQLHGNMETEN